ncbi:contact-dependent growth inhibition system immunity protein [Curtobacterium flaccumfaciens]|uniref:contact-dependent growth inhibition system immunity protein n=1 Tax=Curtobacterium flaccumfaciens TaxID=2035 RepID=UPI00217F0895|nr:contact-dependent growth inhibition system immunity protein [Curtobacterium flaccumfaciens]MCS6557147.1 contact-dependent growth inhibition system immunity protein [Curtobacterium flaccumfaciens]
MIEGQESEYRTELQEYPLLRDLLAAVLDQDWREDCNGVENVCEDLLNDEPHRLRSACAEQIEALLATHSEADVDEVIRASQTGIGPALMPE